MNRTVKQYIDAWLTNEWTAYTPEQIDMKLSRLHKLLNVAETVALKHLVANFDYEDFRFSIRYEPVTDLCRFSVMTGEYGFNVYEDDEDLSPRLELFGTI